MKILSRSVCLLTLALFAVSCIYDYDPQVEGRGEFVVIEGDILVGDTCRFSVGLSSAISGDREGKTAVSYSLQVEASDGTVYPCRDSLVDLTGADRGLEYRLVVEMTHPFQRTYASAWAPVEITPPIDSLSYTISEDRRSLSLNVSTHSDGPLGYYRWTASETWEYTASYYAAWFYAPPGTEYRGRTTGQGEIFEYQDGDNTFFCWNRAERPEIMVKATTSLTEDRLVDYSLYSIPNTDRRVQFIYHVALKQYRISEEAYRYWESLNSSSTDVGGLFSPQPTEYHGNIHNISDPDEQVLGYISVTTESRSQLFIETPRLNFSTWRPIVAPVFIISPIFYFQYYLAGYMVLGITGTGEFQWIRRECVDCRRAGGTKERPSWWINNDK